MSYSITDTRIVGGGIMSKRNLVIEEGSVEALARLQKQDEEFCRRLRAAIETGRECCPTTVFTEPCTNRPVSNYMRPDLIRGYRATTKNALFAGWGSVFEFDHHLSNRDRLKV
jgi:hypothetical protein